MGFRSEYSDGYSSGKSLLGWVVGFGVSALAAWVIWSAVSTPAGVVSRTMQPDNVITRYEWFHDAYGNYKARVSQIAAKKRDVATPDNDAGERYRLRVELGAMQQSCRELSQRYNANATKTNQSIFMGRDAPTSLNPQACE